jgi:hypothetical protein
LLQHTIDPRETIRRECRGCGGGRGQRASSGPVLAALADVDAISSAMATMVDRSIDLHLLIDSGLVIGMPRVTPH